MPAKKKTAKPAAKVGKIVDDEQEEICFCIMPFGGYFDHYYATIYQPAIEAAGLCPKRGDDLYRPSTIVNDIWDYTQRSKVVLADLTGKNPNVFYELGLAHALAKPAILIVNEIEDVPFDLRALRIITYDKNIPKWGDDLYQKIVKAIGEVLASPLGAVLPAFLKVDKSAQPPSVSEESKLLLELRSDLDLLKREVRSRDVGQVQAGRKFDNELPIRSGSKDPVREAFSTAYVGVASGYSDEVILQGMLINGGLSMDTAKQILKEARNGVTKIVT